MSDQTLAQNSTLSGPSEPTRSGPVCAVTVTYGDRQHLLRRVVLAILKQPAVRMIIIVNNGARWNVRALAEEVGRGKIKVVDLQGNCGSAVGFTAGIKRACELRAELIWLLDDDNEPQEGALSELLGAYARLRNNFTEDKLVVAAFRHGLLEGVGTDEPTPSTFLGFHVFDIPRKFWLRIPWRHSQQCGQLPALVEISHGVYGGLLFHHAVVEKHGLPREDFVLYIDDTEFTYRIKRDGGALWLVTAAKIVDLEAGQGLGGFEDSFHLWLKGGSDMRVFYSVRNHVYFDSHCLPRNRLMYWINRRVYCFVLWLAALVLQSMDRYRILQCAIQDGLAGHLGVAPRFPL